MGSLKSPGPDGLNALFYQSQWPTVGPAMVNQVKAIFRHPYDIQNINGTLIVLIPKKDPPESCRDLRPISLCNVIYKVITKVITNRLRPIMPHIISPNQCSFIPGRHSSDNIIVAQEVIHSMSNMKGKKGFMAIKIDLEKAYDRVNWNFLLQCLRDLHLPSSMIEIINASLCTSKFQLLWNGEKAEFFNATRGVRQGDPISPYLFVICMERLAHLIQEKVDNCEWRPIRLTRNGPPITHLFFADDIILFSEASLEQVNMIKSCLDIFCSASGLKVNSAKSHVFFSNNIHYNRRVELSTALCFNLTTDLGKYLGVPLHHQRVTKDSFQSVIDKVKTRLSKWRSNSISLAGRTTLISSVTSAIPNYVMQTSLLPSSNHEVLDCDNRRFLWGSTDEKRRVPLVAWDAVCQEKKHGGLGLRQAKFQNQALLMKLGWKMVRNRDDFWVRVVRDKYKCGNDLLPNFHSKRTSSNVWKGIKSVWGKVHAGLEQTTNNSEIRWKWAKSGMFTVKSAYEQLTHHSAINNRPWEKLWRVKAPQRCRSFAWLAANQRLLTNSQRYHRGLCDNDVCPVCRSRSEDILHVLRDCENTKSLWQRLVPTYQWRRFCSLSFDDWFWENIVYSRNDRKDWGAFFMVLTWWIWRRRNLVVFEGKEIHNDTILLQAKCVIGSMKAICQRLTGTNIPGSRKTTVTNKWIPPMEGWVKCNIDGAYSPSTSSLACGGLIRNEMGQLLHGFLCRLQDGDALSAELWGCLHGLKLAWDLGHRRLILETDSTEVVELCSNDIQEEHADINIIREIQSIMCRDWEVQIQHVDRCSNTAADFLAKEGLNSFQGFHSFRSPPSGLSRLLLQDSCMELVVGD